MITFDNYFRVMKQVDTTLLPRGFQELHILLQILTDNGHNWDEYRIMQDVYEETMSAYILELNYFVYVAGDIQELRYLLNGINS